MSGSAAVATLSQLHNWPGCCAYWQQRKVFAGSNATPTGIWLTQPGNYRNMNISAIPRDDDAITETISAPPPGASVQVNQIRGMVPMPSGLLVFSSGGAWQITGGQQSAAITPATIQAQAHAFTGASDRVAALPISSEVLYVEEKGSNVRDMSYNYYLNIYTGTDLSALSNHLFFGRKIVSWCWAAEPHKLLWVVLDDGVLLSMTYLKEQEIYAWTRHDTQGLVEDVASVSEGGRDAVYLIVRRYVGGAWRRYVERMAQRNFGGNPALGVAPDPALAWCVDSGLAYSRTFPAATLTVGPLDRGQVTLDADADVFAEGDAGKIVRGGGGLAEVIAYGSPRRVVARSLVPMAATLPDDPDATPLPLAAGSWSCTRPVSRVTGLGHLEGKTVAILADGNVVPRQRVVGGAVSLPVPATAVVVGLPYTWQIQTLPLSTGPGVPTTKGHRKLVNSVTLILQDARGVSAGTAWDDLVPLKERNAGDLISAAAEPLYSGEAHLNVNGRWSMRAQVCIQGSDPVPASVLAVVPEVSVGDP